jgi:hypothetical protein
MATATGFDPSTITGWGVDADPRNDPTYPMRDRSGQPEPRNNWPRPVPQGTDIEVLQSVEYNRRPAMFGTGPVPTGASGMIRRAAFRFSENNWWHWLLLIGADRVNVLEGVVADLTGGSVPNVPAEMGVRAEWQHNRAGLLTKIATLAAISTVITIGLSKRRSNSAVRRRR